MTPDAILRSIIDCEACGHDWPRLCAWHADRVKSYVDRPSIGVERERPGYAPTRAPRRAPHA